MVNANDLLNRINNKYSSMNTNEEHLEAMARRIVVKKFLQNLFIHWVKLED